MNQINIVVLTREYPGESAGTKRIHHLLQYQKNKNCEIIVLSIRNKNKLPEEKGEYKNINYIRLGSRLTPRLITFYKFIFLFFQIIFFIYKYKRKGYKNIIYNYGSINIENFIYLIFAKIIGYKIVFDIVEDYTAFTDNYKFISRFKFWTIAKMDKLNVLLANSIIVISTFLEKKYQNMNARNVILIPVSAEINENKRKINNDKFTITYAGSFGDKDGVDMIIEGFSLFNNVFPESILYLIGSGTQQKKYMNKNLKNKNIIFTGFIPDADYYKLIADSDVLCMCRTDSNFSNAGFPFKLGEYLATGNPVIATRVSDVCLYLDETSAFLIEPDNLQQFVDKLLWIKKNRDIAVTIGLNGLEVCKKFFSINLCGEKLNLLIKKI